MRDNATLVLSRVLHTQQSFDQNQESHEESGFAFFDMQKKYIYNHDTARVIIGHDHINGICKLW